MSERRYPEHELVDGGYAHGGHGERPRGATEAGPADDQINVFDLLIVLAKHKLLIFGLPLLLAFAVAIYSLFLPNVYTATTKILPPQQNQSSIALSILTQLGGAVGGALAGAKSTNDVYVAMLKSRTVADNIIERFDLMRVYGEKFPSRARARLAGAADIVAGRDGIITIDVIDVDPKRAAEFANAYVEELMKLTQVLAVTEASQRRLFFERQFAQAKNNLAKTEALTRQALSKGGLVKVDEQGRAMIETTGRLRAQISVKEVQIGAMRAFATDENPELRMAQRELESMRRELARIEGEGDVLGVSGKASSGGMEAMRMLRDLKYHEVVFELLARQYEVAKIDEAKESSVVQVLDSAVVPDVKSGPKRLQMVLLTLLVTFVLAIIAAFVRESLQRARENPEQVSRIETFKRYLTSR